MAITATNTLTVPEKTYPEWWIRQLMIGAPDPAGRATAHIVLAPYNSLTPEICADNTRFVTINIDDVFALAGTTTEVASAMTALFAAVDKVGKDRSVL